MIIYCPSCEAQVSTKRLSSHDKFNVDYDFAPMRYSLLKCPVCEEIQLVEQYLAGYEPENEDHWSSAKRNWPQPELELPLHVPAVTKKSMEEAERCLRAKAFTACAVMTGRALEGICRHYETSSKYLGSGIKELKEQGVIDEKLFEWSEALHLHRNIAAHADERIITEEDAKDLMDFVIAICEYIFVLNEKFKDFKSRQSP